MTLVKAVSTLVFTVSEQADATATAGPCMLDGMSEQR